MGEAYPQYGFTEKDVNDALVRYVRLDNPESYPFDAYHSHEYNEILFFRKGGGIHNISFKEHTIKDYSLHFLSAGDLHWVERSMQSEGFAIVYKDAFLYKLQQNNPSINYISFFDTTRIINLSVKEQNQFYLLLEEINNNSNNHIYLFNLIGAFFTKLAIETNNHILSNKTFNDPVVKSFYELLQKQGSERMKAADYAKELNVSISTLERKIKAATDKTVHSLQQEYLLKEAKRLLIQTDYPLKEIAYQLGFLELSHFSNWFKKHTNEQPGHYRLH